MLFHAWSNVVKDDLMKSVSMFQLQLESESCSGMSTPKSFLNSTFENSVRNSPPHTSKFRIFSDSKKATSTEFAINLEKTKRSNKSDFQNVADVYKHLSSSFDESAAQFESYAELALSVAGTETEHSTIDDDPLDSSKELLNSQISTLESRELEGNISASTVQCASLDPNTENAGYPQVKCLSLTEEWKKRYRLSNSKVKRPFEKQMTSEHSLLSRSLLEETVSGYVLYIRKIYSKCNLFPLKVSLRSRGFFWQNASVIFITILLKK